MLAEVAAELDRWIIDRNLELRAEGLPLLKACEIRVFGQAALLEQSVQLELAATVDVDVKATYEDAVERKFEELLKVRGRTLDPVGREAWMPRDTRYLSAFEGEFVRMTLAEPEAVLVSKGLKAPKKNAPLLTEYLARGASERFLELAAAYHLNLEQFL